MIISQRVHTCANLTTSLLNAFVNNRPQDYERRRLDDMERLATCMHHPEAVECMELSFLD
ncbi:UNVERIFIED_CONTAM: hypothetical protein FKN15_002530 [Acipenser sinensis]